MSATPTASLLTPPGRGALAVIALSGNGAVTVLASLFHPAGTKPVETGDRIYFGHWKSPQGEEVVVTPRRTDYVEIHCHGGRMAASAILTDLKESGCTIEEAGSPRQPPSSILEEAELALAQALTEPAALRLLDQRNGALSRAISDIKALAERGEFFAAIERIDQLLARCSIGLHLTEPWSVAIIGRPNVGKSSLLNALLGFERAIVFDQPGTTRDAVTVLAAMAGWPIELADTAGMRSAQDSIEQAGIEMARLHAEEADLVVLLADASEPWTTEDDALLAQYPDAMVVHNKVDLGRHPSARPAGLLVSAATGLGLENLQQEMARRLVPCEPQVGDAIPFTQRQIDGLQSARNEFHRGDSASAVARLVSLGVPSPVGLHS